MRPQDMQVDEFMGLALAEARAALEHDDVPVGAIVVRHGEVIAARHNERELSDDPVAHAEILALRDAATRLGQWRLDDCTMFVTLEPCPMCAGAIVLSKISRVVFGAWDPKMGASGTVLNVTGCSALNHQPEVYGGIMEHKAESLLQDFFRGLRGR